MTFKFGYKLVCLVGCHSNLWSRFSFIFGPSLNFYSQDLIWDFSILGGVHFSLLKSAKKFLHFANNVGFFYWWWFLYPDEKDDHRFDIFHQLGNCPIFLSHWKFSKNGFHQSIYCGTDNDDHRWSPAWVWEQWHEASDSLQPKCDEYQVISQNVSQNITILLWIQTISACNEYQYPRISQYGLKYLKYPCEINVWWGMIIQKCPK